MPTLMKGNVWGKRKHLAVYPVMVEHKHDEIRCQVLVQSGETCQEVVKFLSYAGKPLANMERFAPLFSALASKSGYNEFDCGFEVNHHFNDSYRWVRSTKALPADLHDAETRFYLFDLPGSTFEYNRRSQLVKHVAIMGGLWTVSGTLCHDEEEVDKAYYAARALGMEGVMVKSLQHMYEPGKRTDGWLKMKPSDDADGRIIAITEAISENGIPLGRAGSVTVKCDDGSMASPHGIPHDLGRDMFENQGEYFGRWCEFRFMERDRQGGYRHPTFHRLREDK